ncbi:TetR/AcrR family transcriptional regulator [Brevibacillus brevis]|uniref:TetR/AcrR family transcriptional regulator n=1 Tax=Brevibacillus brevis TaxID=1393 RepID=A0A2Z4MGJ2_BREBE|nr:TetR/AcrR family transcriptional regulator [Brevibacillus brevis]AWX55616.1 TetR/AcrR family transcriptional regulator [Brevibacillus brevis]
MSRPREFDVDRALQQSMEVFWAKGFKSTSYDDLTRTTQVKKQSLYCVFKDKRDLFLKALALYRERSIAMLEELASQEVSPLKKLEAICDSTLYQNDETLRRGCLMVNSALEFGDDDPEVNREVMLMFDQVERILEKIIRDGQKQGLISARQSSKELAVYLNNVLSGAKVMEKSGASREQIATVLRTSFALMISENAR